MTVAATSIKHMFGGGWSPDFRSAVDAPPQSVGPGCGMLEIPYLLAAENCIFTPNGGLRKMPGLAKLNSTAMESGAVIKGVYDFWLTGGIGAPAQHRICHVSTKLKKDDADGTFTDLLTGLTADAVPTYAVLEDLLVTANLADSPKSWDGTTAQALAGTPPQFAWVVTHKNRMFGGGTAANPSRLYYSAFLNPADWTGPGSGTIDVNPDDNDGLVGAVSYKNELILFKGPYKGSIHRLTGSSPADFARLDFVPNVGGIGHNTICPYRDDIAFVSTDGTLRSLSATAAYGDLTEGALSYPLNQWLNDNANIARLRHSWIKDWPVLGVLLWALPINGATNPNTVLMMDYRQGTQNLLGEHQQEMNRWGQWRVLMTQATCLAEMVDASDSSKRIIVSGGSDGFIRKHGRRNRSIDSVTAISMTARTPSFTYGTPVLEKTVQAGAVGFSPKGAGDAVFRWTRDNRAPQEQLVSQQGFGAVLGPSATNPFILDSSTLGGNPYVELFFELHEGGPFRSLALEISHGDIDEDIEVQSMSVVMQGPGSFSLVNTE